MTTEFHGTVESDNTEEGSDLIFGVCIVFPRAAAPDAPAAMERLFEAFPDHEPILLSESKDRWIFRLDLASDPHIFVDPEVPSVARDLYALSLSGIGDYHELHSWGKSDAVISLIHSWALLAPAKVIERRGKNSLLWVVHLDDHTDLMAAFLEPLPQLGLLRDYVFEEVIDIGDPDSVGAAVRRGVVSKGNFLTAYLLAYPGCRVVHIGRNLAEQDFRLSRQPEAVELGGRQFTSYGFVFEPSSMHEPWTFRQTRSLPTDLPIGEQDGVWLDVDLDYFCNRYNGDSDRRSEVALPGERDEVMRQVDNFLAKLCNATWLTKIDAVSVAMSPGFFPAEYWAEVVAVVCNGIRKNLEA